MTSKASMRESSQPRIDILLASFNGERFIEQQISSIRAQTYQNWRLIISDDGSTDGTVALIRRIASIDARIEVRSHAPLGSAASNFLRMLRDVEGEYAMFCDQDDFWLPEKLQESLVEMMKIEDGGVTPCLVAGNAVLVDARLKPLGKTFLDNARIDPRRTALRQVLVQSPVLGCSSMMNRSLVEIARSIDPIEADIRWHDWWMALIAAAFGKVSVLPAALLEYRQHESNQVGASGYSVRSLLRIGRDGWKRADRIRRQAEELLRCCGATMPNEARATISQFVQAHNRDVLRNLQSLTSGGFTKSGHLRNLGYIFTAATLKCARRCSL